MASVLLALVATSRAVPSVASDLKLAHVEVTQGIQDDKQSVPLLSGRTTFVRTFFDVTASTPVAVTGKLTLTDPPTGDQIEVSAMGSIAAKLDPALNGKLQAQRQLASSGLVFRVPSEWADRASFTIDSIAVTRRRGPPTMTCDGCASLDKDVTLEPASPLKIRMILLRYSKGGRTFQPRQEDYDYAVSFLRRSFPAGSFDIETRFVDWNPNPVIGGPRPTFSCDVANTLLIQLRKMDVEAGGDPRTHYYGMVYDGGSDVAKDDFTQFMRGCASVIPTRPDPSAVASGPAGIHNPTGWSRSPTYGDWYAAHEIGHTFGRSHVGTPCQDAPEDHNYPIRTPQRGLIANDQNRYLAFDAGDETLGLAPVVLPAFTTFDSMTYCGDGQWPGHYTYLGIRTELAGEQRGIDGVQGAVPAAEASPAATSGPPAPANAGPPPANPLGPKPYVMISGHVNYTRNTATFFADPADAAPPSAAPTTNEFAVEVRDAQNGLLARADVVSTVSTDRPPNADETGNISAIVPNLPGAERIDLLRNGTVIASLGKGTPPRRRAGPGRLGTDPGGAEPKPRRLRRDCTVRHRPGQRNGGPVRL
jgi:hypothetical protein